MRRRPPRAFWVGGVLARVCLLGTLGLLAAIALGLVVRWGGLP